ncbi:MAG: hypothetical protein WBB93_05040 [Saprospiraceae bacterium]
MQIKHFFIFILVSSSRLLFFYCTSDKAPRQTQSLEYDMISVKDSDVKTLIKYDSLGQKLIEGNVINGKKNGSWITYAPGGGIMDITNYIEDVKQGPYIKLNGGNNIVEQGSFKDNSLHGQVIKYLYGHLDEKIEFKDGVKDGWARKYYMHGGLQYEMQVKGEIQQGLYRFYGEDGKLQIEETFKDGKKISGGMVH